ncbi:protein of unknown function (plasmid) [Cupriavidus taiwanensis]|uniref:Uncharacterized protein n=1 Tax=Cupriavidus taiwanensis TaxID=164546 RepID=A0A375H9R3_9BURK|nr:protein of unknown function [Cupriavidus taiwanensis]SOZ72153.1 protein of unknown function [Cupriavidus taiwanensis]SOZ74450.1 protein of unknown function [Cupriavidus taiwanensis]SPA03402.1 protein of unknown function [Cupriavidus taiwanensis]SPA11372.1 protein of unknown function [Cupriavidus taiwanensis]
MRLFCHKSNNGQVFDNCERQNNFRHAPTGGIVCGALNPTVGMGRCFAFHAIASGTAWYIFD